MRDPQYQDRLERVIHHELSKLPSAKAPSGLIEKVRQSIAAYDARPWYRKSWIHWPRKCQFLLLGFLLSNLLGCTWLLAAGAGYVEGFITSTRFWSESHNISLLLGATASIAQAALDILSTLPWQWTAGLAACAGILYSTSIGLGWACYRVASRKAFA